MENTDSQKIKPPTFQFKNIGPVNNAELELGDLTIIAGRNNTGKTYLVYTLYGFLRTWESWYDAYHILQNAAHDDLDLPDMDCITDKVSLEGRASFPFNKAQFKQQQKAVAQELARNFLEDGLSYVFSAELGDFEDSSVEVNFSEYTFNDIWSVEIEVNEDVSLTMEYDGSSVVVSTDAKMKIGDISELHVNIIHLFLMLLLQDQLPNPFILSAERFGISLFYKELDLNKNRLVDALKSLGENKSIEDAVIPFLLIDKFTSRYALPIRDNINHTRDISNLKKGKSEIFESKLFDNIKNMMDGYYGSSDDDIRFISKTRKRGSKFNVPLHLASSSARGLADFYFYLKHVAKKNHLLIVDEPESHLDTANQIHLARLLARCVRAGLKVLITTHSDYIVKEINNLVMLSRPFKGQGGGPQET